jgi:hypothetical protein
MTLLPGYGMIGPMAVYFAYGSNMSSARLAARIPAVEALGAAFVRDWRLAFNKPGRDGTGKANLVPAAGERAWGVAWKLVEAHWETLDRFEPGYQREIFRLERSDGTVLDAHAYLFDPGGPVLAPSRDYVEHLISGSLEHGLPDHYIETIRATSGLASRVG